MSLRSWLILLLFYIGFLFLGAILFHVTECPEELTALRNKLEAEGRVLENIERMRRIVATEGKEVLEEIVGHWSEQGFVMGNGSVQNGTEPKPECIKWDHQNAFFFAFTVVTTIGYGHQAPTTTHGRMLCLLYALIGVPLNALLIGAIGRVYRDGALRLKNKVWASVGKSETELGKKPRLQLVIVEALGFFLLWFVAFIPIPALVFSALENDKQGFREGDWSFLDSFYYTFVTLSTIGFGDMVPDRQQNMMIKTKSWRSVYLAGIIIWIILGMGYIFGVVEVISGTFKFGSKPVRKAIQGLKNQLHLDAYWRKIIGEIILLKQGKEEDLGSGGGVFETRLEDVDDGGQDNLGLKKVGDSMEDPVYRTMTPSDLPLLHVQDMSVLNQETITSLRQLLTSLPEELELPEEEAASRRLSQVFGSDTGQDPVYLTVQPDRDRVRRPTPHYRKASMISQAPVTSLLEQTTLGEFLTAVENVRRKSMMEPPRPNFLAPTSNQPSRKTSLAGLSGLAAAAGRKFSGRKTSSSSATNPILSVLRAGREETSQTEIPLILDTSSSSSRSQSPVCARMEEEERDRRESGLQEGGDKTVHM